MHSLVLQSLVISIQEKKLILIVPVDLAAAKRLPHSALDIIHNFKTVEFPTPTRLYKLLLRDNSFISQLLNSPDPKIKSSFPKMLLKLVKKNSNPKFNLRQQALVKEILNDPRFFNWNQVEQPNEFKVSNYPKLVSTLFPVDQTPGKGYDPESNALLINYLTENGMLDTILQQQAPLAAIRDQSLMLCLFADIENERLIQQMFQLIEWDENMIFDFAVTLVQKQKNQPSSKALSFILTSDAAFNRLVAIQDIGSIENGYFLLHYFLFKAAIEKDVPSVASMIIHDSHLPWDPEEQMIKWWDVYQLKKIKSREMGLVLKSERRIVSSILHDPIPLLDNDIDFTYEGARGLFEIEGFFQRLDERDLNNLILAHLEMDHVGVIKASMEFPETKEIIMHEISELIDDLRTFDPNDGSLMADVDYLSTVFQALLEDYAQNKLFLETFVRTPFIVRKIPNEIGRFVEMDALMSDDFLKPIWEATTDRHLREVIAKYVYNKETFSERNDEFWNEFPGLADTIFGVLNSKREIKSAVKRNPSWSHYVTMQSWLKDVANTHRFS